MKKEELLTALNRGVVEGIITRQDIDEVLGVAIAQPSSQLASPQSEPKKFSVVAGILHAVGVVLYGAVFTVIAQTWEGGFLLHLMLTLVLGSAAWTLAYVVSHASDEKTDLRQGLIGALLITGSLLLITGGYIITNQFGVYGTIDFYQAIPALVILAVVHIGFHRLLHRDVLFIVGMLLGVSAIGALIFGLLKDAHVSGDIVAIVLIALGGLLAWATHTIARLNATTSHLRAAYDHFAIVLAFIVSYVSSFGDWAGFWYLVLVAGIIGVFYLSITMRQKILLGTASSFLVLTIITVSFRYFSGFSATVSLLVSALGLVAVAILASSLSKKYMQ